MNYESDDLALSADTERTQLQESEKAYSGSPMPSFGDDRDSHAKSIRRVRPFVLLYSLLRAFHDNPTNSPCAIYLRKIAQPCRFGR